MVQALTLKGHKSSVLSLAHSSETISSLNSQTNKKKKKKQSRPHSTICHLLSGDENGTTRVWDLRYNSKRASHCIVAPNDGDEREVTAVGFHPFLDVDIPVDASADTGTPDSKEGSCPFTV